MLLGLVRAVLSKITQFREVPTSVIKLVIAGLTNNRKGFNILCFLSRDWQRNSWITVSFRNKDSKCWFLFHVSKQETGKWNNCFETVDSLPISVSVWNTSKLVKDDNVWTTSRLRCQISRNRHRFVPGYRNINSFQSVYNSTKMMYRNFIHMKSQLTTIMSSFPILEVLSAWSLDSVSRYEAFLFTKS